MGCYLQDLQVAFSDVAWFFCDRHGGDTIAVVWKARDQESTWKLDLKFNYSPISGQSTPVGPKKTKKQKLDAKIKINYTAMLAEMERLGQGLVAGMDI